MRTHIEQQLAGGQLREAFDGAQALLQRARAAGEQAYPDADYDLAGACFLLAHVLTDAGASENALPLLEEARHCFEALEKKEPGRGAERMASVCITEQGDSLCDLGRLDEARQEIRRAIECKAQFGHASVPWMSWGILADIERDARNPAAAAEAKRKAIACYLDYRRDGGENHSDVGRVCFAVTQSLLAGDVAAAETFLLQVAADHNLPSYAITFIHVLQSIVTGSRNRTLADALDLTFEMAAEILFLIETLEQQGL